jgi:hypothetical protein
MSSALVESERRSVLMINGHPVDLRPFLQNITSGTSLESNRDYRVSMSAVREYVRYGRYAVITGTVCYSILNLLIVRLLILNKPLYHTV